MGQVRPLTLVLFALNIIIGGAAIVDEYWHSDTDKTVPREIQTIIADHCKICHDRSQTAAFFRAEAKSELEIQGIDTLNPVMPFGDLSEMRPAEIQALKARIAAMLTVNLMPREPKSFFSDLSWQDDERKQLLAWARSD